MSAFSHEGTTHGYGVEVRTTGKPFTWRGMILTDSWQRVPMTAAHLGDGNGSLFTAVAERDIWRVGLPEHGIFNVEAATAVAYVILAEMRAGERYCTAEVRLVKYEATFSVRCKEVGVAEAIQTPWPPRVEVKPRDPEAPDA